LGNKFPANKKPSDQSYTLDTWTTLGTFIMIISVHFRNILNLLLYTWTQALDICFLLLPDQRSDSEIPSLLTISFVSDTSSSSPQLMGSYFLPSPNPEL
jgi:hypothetical protein